METADAFVRPARAADAADLGGYQPRDRQRPVSPALRLYAAMATSGSTGAVRDISQLGTQPGS